MLNLKSCEMKRSSSVALLSLTVVLSHVAAPAAQHDKAECTARPYAAPAEARAEMARYSLKAYGNRDATNVVKGLLFTPKPLCMKIFDSLGAG